MKCEFCGKEHNGKYGSGRFCSSTCARAFSTKNKRDNINKSVSEKLKGRKTGKRSPETVEKAKEALKRSLKLKFSNKPVRLHSGVTLDITKEELDKYRADHKICEICGMPSTVSTVKGKSEPNALSVDHDHETNRFRGLLCQNCNSRLGWYENHKAVIEEYIKRGRMAELVDAETLKIPAKA